MYISAVNILQSLQIWAIELKWYNPALLHSIAHILYQIDLYRAPKSEICFAQGEPLLSSSLFQNLRVSFCHIIMNFITEITSSEMQSKIGSGHL